MKLVKHLKSFRWLAAIAVTACLSVSAVSPVRLRTTVEWLSDSMREGRASTSEGAEAAGDYLLEQFEAAGLASEFQNIDASRRNVIGRVGTAERHIIIGSHYDGQGRGFPSASDNAAGVAIMVELARELAGMELPVSLLFVAFDDEERGLAGSRHYVRNPVLPLEDVIAVVIMDTMGRSFLDLERWTLIALGSEFSPQLSSIVRQRGGDKLVLIGTDLIGPRSDYASFARQRVPYLFFSNATHEDYHGAGDTPDRLRYDQMDSDQETIREVILDIAALPQRPAYLREPVYPENEAAELVSLLETILVERNELSAQYGVLVDDLKERLSQGPLREDLRLATSVLLAMATPRVSGFSLAALIGPFYESEGKVAEARAAYEEALRWTTNALARATIENKLDTLN
jgi:hypothetical protein